MLCGGCLYEGGRTACSPPPSCGLLLRSWGCVFRRFKPALPARVLRSSIDFSGLEQQDEAVVPFSFETFEPLENRLPCHLSRLTRPGNRRVILRTARAALACIEGGRYCPSIEDKIVRFADKERHQVFIEPCGLQTEEMYLQGLSSSLPVDVQLRLAHHSRAGACPVMRPAYAIEMTVHDPFQLDASAGIFGYPRPGAGRLAGSLRVGGGGPRTALAGERGLARY